jgi:Gas vesicle synthesis protein GvpO
VADEKPRRRRRKPKEAESTSNAERRKPKEKGSSNGERKRTSKRGLSGAQLAQRARRDLAEITGLEAESVTSLERSDDGTWRVTVELLELSRIPETDDMLGSYEAELDESGELVGYRRLRRYARSQAQAGEQQGAGGGK